MTSIDIRKLGLVTIMLMVLVVPVLASTATIYAPVGTDGYNQSDAAIWRSGQMESPAEIRVGAGTGIDLNGSLYSGGVSLIANTTADKYRGLYRYAWCGDTSTLPDSSIITDVKFYVRKPSSASTTGLGSSNISISGFTPDDPTWLKITDFDNTIDTFYSNNLTVAGWRNGYYDYFTFNAAGKTAVNTTGYTCIMLRHTGDIDGWVDWTPVWSSGAESRFSEYTAEYPARNPYMVITYGAPPTAAFSGTPTTHSAPSSVVFTDTSSGTPTSWNWSFGDGTFSTSQNPTHSYTIVGTYTVNLTATNAYGSTTESKTNYITVTDPPPTAAFSGTPRIGSSPLTVTFTDSSTETPSSWLWDFGDGSSENSTLQNPTHTYASDGYYDVSLTATNAYGSDVETKTNYVSTADATYGEHPYMLFRNITDVPGFQNRNKTPWSSWHNSIVASGLASNSYPTRAVYYHICENTGGSSCTNYANSTVLWLLNTNPAAYVGSRPYGNLGWYSITYDLIAGERDTGNTIFNETLDTIIRDKLAVAANTAYTSYTPGAGVDYVDKDAFTYFNIWAAGEALQDYDTTGKGLSSGPSDWVKLGTLYFFESDALHSPSSSANHGLAYWNTNKSDGFTDLSSYLSYFSEEWSYMPLIYSNIYGNIFELHPEFEKYFTSIVYQRLPNGYTPNLVTYGNLKLNYYAVGYEWLSNESRANLRWSNAQATYSNGLLQYSDKNYASSTLVSYLSIDDYTSESRYAPTNKNNLGITYATVRNGWTNTSDFISLIGKVFHTGMWSRGSTHPDAMSVEYYSHGDLTLLDAGETKKIGYRPDSYTMHNVMLLTDPRVNLTYYAQLYSTADWLVGGELYGATGTAAWHGGYGGGGGVSPTGLTTKIGSSAIGYVEGTATTSTRTSAYPGIKYGPIWGDTIRWSRAVASPENEYMIVIDRGSSTNTWGYKNLWRLGSFNITPTGSTSYYPTLGHTNGSLTIGTTGYDWEALTYSDETYTGLTENKITWDTVNPYGDEVTTVLFSSPASNISVYKWITRVAGYGRENEVFTPHIFMTEPDDTSIYRVTALLSSWKNGTDTRTPTELAVTGTGHAIKVVNIDSTKTDFIYTGLGTSSFDNYETDADTAIIRQNVSGKTYSFTLRNGTYLNKSGTNLFDSTTKLTFISAITKENGTRFNISGSGATTLKFYNTIPIPTSLKIDDVESGGWSMDGTTLVLDTTLSEHVIQFGNGNEIDYPDAPVYEYEGSSPETWSETIYAISTNADAQIGRIGVNESYADIVAGAGNNILLTGDGSHYASDGEKANTTIDEYQASYIYGWTGDTSPIPDTATITAATFWVYGGYKTPGLSSSSNTVTEFHPTDPTLLTIDDYNRTQNIIYTTNVSYSAFLSPGWVGFSFTNLSAIDKTGYTSLAIRTTDNIDATDSGFTWAANATNRNFLAETSTTYPPKLIATYSLPESVAPTASISASATSGEVPLTVYFSDASIGGNVTNWSWNFDGINTSSLQDPEWTFESTGTFNVSLFVENDIGNDTAYQLINVTTSGDAPISHFYMNVSSSSEYGASSYNTTGYTVGGGAAYHAPVTSGTYTVTNKAELLTALLTATSGDVVYIPGGTTIDMTGTLPTRIPAGVTLASNRSNLTLSGAIIKKTLSTSGYAGNSSTTRYSSSTWEETMFYAGGNNVRVTGLILEGEMKPQDDTSVSEEEYLVGLFARGVDNFTVDNNEIRGWSWSGVQTAWCTDVLVNNNYIHSNQARGEGYGSSQYGGEVVYDRNLYDYNRHSITSSGLADESYIARYNIVKANGAAIGSVHFDVHEDEDFGGRAGDYYYIHHNTFQDGVGWYDDGADAYWAKMASVHIRHTADTGLYISNNLFEAESTETPGELPIYQTQTGGTELTKVYATNNMWMGTIFPDNTGIAFFWDV